MKTKVLRKLVTARQWANTEKGEKVIVYTLSTLTGVWALCVLALIIGSLS